MAYLLEHDSVTKTPAEWGVELATLTVGNQLADELRLTVSVKTIADAPVFAIGDEIVLWRDSTRVFRGVVTELPAEASGREQLEYVVSGPWWTLSRCAYMQGRVTWGEIDDPDEETETETTRVVLAMGAGIATPISAGAQIEAALEWAIDKYSLDLEIGSIEIGSLRPPYEEAKDISVAEVISRMLRYLPDAVVHFDYSGATTEINITRRGDMTPVELDLDDTTTSHKIEAAKARPRHDLVPSGVLFIFERTVVVDVDGVARRKIKIASQSAGGGASAPGAIVYTFQLASSATGAGEPIPTGLAAAYYSALSTLQWQGEVSLVEREVSQVIKLGDVVDIVGGPSGWSSMHALVQAVEYDFGEGRTRVTFGPAEQLGPQDFKTLIANNRTHMSASTFPATKNTGDPPSTPNDPTPMTPPSDDEEPPVDPYNPTPWVDLAACVDGAPVTVRVLGFIKA